MLNLTLPKEFLTFSGPPSLGFPAIRRTMHAYNPSIVRFALCDECAYVVSFRVDAMHQCDETTPLRAKLPHSAAHAWFKGTAIAVYSESWTQLAITWLINSPSDQLRNKKAR